MSRRTQIWILVALAAVLVVVYLANRTQMPGLQGVMASDGKFQPLNVDEPQLRLDLLEKLRARQRVGDAHAHIVRACCLQQLARCEDVGEFLVEVTELDEEAHPNAVRFQTRPRLLDLRIKSNRFLLGTRNFAK